MIDVTSWNPMWIQIPFFLFIILGVLLGAKDGILRKIFDFLFLVLLFFLMMYMVPPFAKYLESTGFIQNFVNQNLSGDLASLAQNLLTGPVYSIIAGLIILIAYFILKFILNFFIKVIFKHKGVINRVLGAIWQGTVHVVIAGIFLVIFASPAIFTGGTEVINKAAGVKEFYGGVTKVQEVLKEHNIPYSIESMTAKMILGNETTPEDIARFESTFARLDQLMKNPTGQELVDKDGHINQEDASLLIDDVIVLSQIMQKMPESAQEKYKSQVESVVTSIAGDLDPSKVAENEKLQLTQEQKDSLEDELKRIGVAQETINTLTNLVVIK